MTKEEIKKSIQALKEKQTQFFNEINDQIELLEKQYSTACTKEIKEKMKLYEGVYLKNIQTFDTQIIYRFIHLIDIYDAEDSDDEDYMNCESCTYTINIDGNIEYCSIDKNSAIEIIFSENIWDGGYLNPEFADKSCLSEYNNAIAKCIEFLQSGN